MQEIVFFLTFKVFVRNQSRTVETRKLFVHDRPLINHLERHSSFSNQADRMFKVLSPIPPPSWTGLVSCWLYQLPDQSRRSVCVQLKIFSLLPTTFGHELPLAVCKNWLVKPKLISSVIFHKKLLSLMIRRGKC